MAEKGWIKLHRRLLDCWIWDVKPFDKGRAWVDLLLLAMHHDKKIVIEDKPTIISRGSYFTSRGQLADRWGWSVKKVDTYLKTLEKEEMVTTHRTPKGTTITIVNYEEYQIEGTTKDTTEDTTVGIAAGTTQDITEDIAQDTAVDIQNKNIKNDKNVKNKKKEPTTYYPDNKEMDDAFKEFLSMRTRIKKPLATKQALTRMMNKIEKLSGRDSDLAIKILNQSTDHCWQDVYDLKNNYSRGDNNRNNTANNAKIEKDKYAEELYSTLDSD